MPRCERCSKVIMSGPLNAVVMPHGHKREICEECVTSLTAWWYAVEAKE